MNSTAQERHDERNLQVGSIFHMFWKQDLTRYRGTFVNAEGAHVSILYDDGDKEEIEDITQAV